MSDTTWRSDGMRRAGAVVIVVGALLLAGCGASGGDKAGVDKDVSVDKLADLKPTLEKGGFACKKPGKPTSSDDFELGGEAPKETMDCKKGGLTFEIARWRSAAVADESMGAALLFACGFGAGSFDYVDGGNWIGALNSSDTDSKAKKKRQLAVLAAAAKAAGIEPTHHKCASKSGKDSSGDSGDQESDGPGSTRDDPLAVGKSMTIDDYEVTVTDIEVDATETVKAEDEFNEDPTKGQYMLVTLDVTYEGDTEGRPEFDLNVALSGSDKVQYDQCQASLKDDDVPTIENGGKATMRQCIDAPPSAIDGGVLLVKDTFGRDRGYWKLPG